MGSTVFETETSLAQEPIITDFSDAPIAILPQFVESRLTVFGKEKDIDIQEIAILLQSTNPQWVAEASRFASLYDATWQVFYASSATTWQQLETELPALTWE